MFILKTHTINSQWQVILCSPFAFHNSTPKINTIKWLLGTRLFYTSQVVVRSFTIRTKQNITWKDDLIRQWMTNHLSKQRLAKARIHQGIGAWQLQLMASNSLATKTKRKVTWWWYLGVAPLWTSSTHKNMKSLTYVISNAIHVERLFCFKKEEVCHYIPWTFGGTFGHEEIWQSYIGFGMHMMILVVFTNNTNQSTSLPPLTQLLPIKHFLAWPIFAFLAHLNWK